MIIMLPARLGQKYPEPDLLEVALKIMDSKFSIGMIGKYFIYIYLIFI